METAQEYWTDLCLCFIDYSKAFDCVDNSIILWGVLREMGAADHLVALICNLYDNQLATIRTEYGSTDVFGIGKGLIQGCILSPSLFNMYGESIMRRARLENSLGGLIIGGLNINNLRYADDTTLIADSRESLAEVLCAMKQESEI